MAPDRSHCRYLETMRSYFEDFFRRAKPLFNVTELRATARAKIDTEWRDGRVAGWEKAAGAEEELESGLFCPACKYLLRSPSVAFEKIRPTSIDRIFIILIRRETVHKTDRL